MTNMTMLNIYEQTLLPAEYRACFFVAYSLVCVSVFILLFNTTGLLYAPS